VSGPSTPFQSVMTDKQPHTPFLDTLDRKTLDAIEERLAKLLPLVQEYRELQRRRQTIESRYGLNRTSERVISVLAEYPEGLSSKQLSEMIDRPSPVIRSTLTDLVRKGNVARLARGLYGYVNADGITEVMTRTALELGNVTDREEVTT